MFRIAKPESFVLLSPSRQDVSCFISLIPLCAHRALRIGWKAKRCRVHAAHYGTTLCVLQQSAGRIGLSIAIPLSYDCL